MFRGSFEHTVDEKGRIIIPQRFRNDLGNNFIVAKSLEGCILISRVDQWVKSVEENLTARSIFDKKSANLLRFLNAGMFEGVADSAGRIALAKDLRDHAGIALASDVIIIGLTTRIEIWSRKRWDDLNATITNDYLEAAAIETGLVNAAIAVHDA